MLAKLLRKRPVDESSRGLAKVLELGVIARSSILQAEYVKEVLTAQRQVDVFTEAFDNGPALADGCSTLEEQVIPARSVEQGIEDSGYPPVFFYGAVFYVLSGSGRLNCSQTLRCSEVLPKTHCLSFLRVLTKIRRIQYGIAARSA